ncbi:MAG TPA: indole-3-glycerol phosphate synthase TrpC [Sphingobacteriaceae bacterium]
MTILETIVEKKKEEVTLAKAKTAVISLEETDNFRRECYRLKDFLTDTERTGIIAEFKRKSPSKGMLNNLASVDQVTRGYAAAGASAVSVLTDTAFFDGFNRDLEEARKVNELPVLRKDFTIDEYQIIEAKSLGADIILLIAAVLPPERVKVLARTAKDLGLNVLLEVHTREELESSLCDELDAVGVNNRNLADFTVRVDTSLELVSLIPDRYMKISESGISSPETIRLLKDAGFNGFLIGECFMKEKDPGAAMKSFTEELKTLTQNNR